MEKQEEVHKDLLTLDLGLRIEKHGMLNGPEG